MKKTSFTLLPVLACSLILFCACSSENADSIAENPVTNSITTPAVTTTPDNDPVISTVTNEVDGLYPWQTVKGDLEVEVYKYLIKQLGLGDDYWGNIIIRSADFYNSTEDIILGTDIKTSEFVLRGFGANSDITLEEYNEIRAVYFTYQKALEIKPWSMNAYDGLIMFDSENAFVVDDGRYPDLEAFEDAFFEVMHESNISAFDKKYALLDGRIQGFNTVGYENLIVREYISDITVEGDTAYATVVYQKHSDGSSYKFLSNSLKKDWDIRPYLTVVTYDYENYTYEFKKDSDGNWKLITEPYWFKILADTTDAPTKRYVELPY